MPAECIEIKDYRKVALSCDALAALDGENSYIVSSSDKGDCAVTAGESVAIPYGFRINYKIAKIDESGNLQQRAFLQVDFLQTFNSIHLEIDYKGKRGKLPSQNAKIAQKVFEKFVLIDTQAVKIKSGSYASRADAIHDFCKNDFRDNPRVIVISEGFDAAAFFNRQKVRSEK